MKTNISVLALFLAITFSGCSTNEQYVEQARLLLDDTGVAYQLKGCNANGNERELACEVVLNQDAVNKIVTAWDLNVPLENYPDQKHVIFLKDNEDPMSPFLRNQYSRAFAVPEWQKAKFGFWGAILFYNQSTQKACFFLNIAYI
ncbi:MAG: hypothetical protein HQL19_06655 [Candidatus Omnitrophica bacterium]|nr:hypothetical protein [Candidatus Omnitrophota bacterium]